MRYATLTALLVFATGVNAQQPGGILGTTNEADKTGRIVDLISQISELSDELESKRFAMVVRGDKLSIRRSEKILENGFIFVIGNEPARKLRFDASARTSNSSSGIREMWEQELTVDGKKHFRRLIGGRTQTEDQPQRPGSEPRDLSSRLIKIDPIQYTISRANSIARRGTVKDMAAKLFLNNATLKEGRYTDEGDIYGKWNMESVGNVTILSEIEVLFAKDAGFLPVDVKAYSQYKSGNALSQRGLRSHTRTRWGKIDGRWLPIEIAAVSISPANVEDTYQLDLKYRFVSRLGSIPLVDKESVDWRARIRELFDESWAIPEEYRVLLREFERLKEN